MTAKRKQKPEALTTEIEEYSPTAAALSQLRADYEGAVFDVTTTKGMKEAKAARAELRGLRTALEAKRVEIKRPALQRCNMIDAEAKRIRTEIERLEIPIAETIKEEETRAERERQAKIRAEEERIEKHESRIASIRAIPGDLPNPASLVDIKAARETLDGLALDVDFEEFAIEAQDAVASVRAKLTDAEAEARERERKDAELAELKRKDQEREAEEAKRREAERQERARVDSLRSDIAEFRGAPEMVRKYWPMPSAKVREHLVDLEKIPVTKEHFGDLFDEAQDAKAAAVAAMKKLVTDAEKHEAEEAELERLRKAEADRKDAEAAEERRKQEAREKAEREEFPGTEDVLSTLALAYDVERDVAIQWIAKACDELEAAGEIVKAGA